MTSLELANVTLKRAESDMRFLRKRGELGMTQTKHGYVTLYYHADTKQYEARTVYRPGGDLPRRLFMCGAAEAKVKIAELYNVVEA
jgi:hypothetical protein